MAKEGSFGKYLLIVVFAAGVVILGAKELNRRYVRSGNRSGASGRELVKELHGEFDVLRARLGQSEVAAAKDEEEPKNTPEPKREGKAPAPAQQKTSKDSSSSNGGEDKEQMQKVIDSLVP